MVGAMEPNPQPTPYKADRQTAKNVCIITATETAVATIRGKHGDRNVG